MQFDEKTGKIIAEKFDLDCKRNFDINNFPTEAEVKSQKIHEFYLSFYSYKGLNINESRRLIVNCIELLLNKANEDKKIKRRTDGSIADCYLSENIIHYTIINDEGFLEDNHNDIYEEALKIVHEEQAQAK